VAAFQRLRNASHIIGYYGSYKHGETRHILLEYADRGDLETNFMEVDPPQKGEDILRFWKGILNLVVALVAIHAIKPPQGVPGAVPVFQG
jgi:serine/threonine protein kinase